MSSTSRKKLFSFPKNFDVIKKNNGFTLIEILIAIGIILIITVVTLFSLSTLNKQVSLESASQNILSTLRLARSQTLASKSQSAYGVHFETTKYVLFTGTSYTDGAAGNKEYLLGDSEISSISLNGAGGEVVFARIRGSTTQYGSVVVRLTSDTNKSKTINIDSSGQVSLNDTITSPTARLADSRHLHFDLSWSLQTAVTLTLTFHNSLNPDTVQNIAMAGFFDGPKSVFDWSGTVDVNGSNQTLRVHTHSLDAFDTELSITRDKRYNDKAVDVSIDSKAIVSFSAAGVATVGAYGGTMTTQ